MAQLPICNFVQVPVGADWVLCSLQFSALFLVASVQYGIKSQTWIFGHVLGNTCPLGFPLILFLFSYMFLSGLVFGVGCGT